MPKFETGNLRSTFEESIRNCVHYEAHSNLTDIITDTIYSNYTKFTNILIFIMQYIHISTSYGISYAVLITLVLYFVAFCTFRSVSVSVSVNPSPSLNLSLSLDPLESSVVFQAYF